MTVYAICFELSAEYNQEDFFSTLVSIGDGAPVTTTMWIVKSEKTAKEIRDELYSIMAPEERVMVMKSASPAAWKNVLCDNKWLVENISNKF